jgi:hypothetical protein
VRFIEKNGMHVYEGNRENRLKSYTIRKDIGYGREREEMGGGALGQIVFL